MGKHAERTEKTFELERLIFFSDAVFAIAITLLALELRLPALPAGLSLEQAQAEMTRGLVDLLPEIVSFFVSFFVIGAYWIGHHRMYSYIQQYDRVFLWLNLLFLMCIILIPPVSALLGEYDQLQVATVLYAGVIAATGLVMSLLWWYAAHHHLVTPDLDSRARRALLAPSLITFAAFALSILLSFYDNRLAQYTWYLIALITFFRPRR